MQVVTELPLELAWRGQGCVGARIVISLLLHCGGRSIERPLLEWCNPRSRVGPSWQCQTQSSQTKELAQPQSNGWTLPATSSADASVRRRNDRWEGHLMQGLTCPLTF